MENYPFTKCLHPQRVHNNYTHETYVLPCGRCEYCLMQKGRRYSTLCQLEAKSHEYQMFVTLTYANYALPVMQVMHINRYKDPIGVVCDTKSNPVLVDVTKNTSTMGEILGECCSGPLQVSSISRKCNLPVGLLPHLSKYDLQLFIKRLRKKISKYSNEKVRYFACGEYGPIHFRPHYHLSLWFSDPKIYDNIRQDILACWQFGRVDVQKSLGKSSNYVAKYLNSYSSLPRVFQESKTKPFILHSQHLGEMVFRQSREEVYALSPREFIKRGIFLDGAYSEFTMWRSFKTYFFPKCKGFASFTFLERRYAYTVYAKVRDWTKKTLISEQASYILDTIFGVASKFGTDILHIDYDINLLLKYFLTQCNINPYLYADYDKYYSRIYSILRLSKHFLSFVCNGDDSDKSISYGISIIENFWLEHDKILLNESLYMLEEFSENVILGEEDFNLLYYNRYVDIDYYKSTSFFKRFLESAKKNIEINQKHKRLNDLNRAYSDM